MPNEGKTKLPGIRKHLYTYGLPLILPDQLSYDRCAFARRWPEAPDRPILFRRIAEAMLPGHFEWHTWTHRIINAGCGNSVIALAGCASSAKTYNVASFAAVWWLCDPEDSSVMFISTTRDSLRKRGWAEIANVYSRLQPEKIGSFVDSRMIWHRSAGDAKHCIFGKAVEQGQVAAVADDMKGVHTRRQMIVIDEATAVSGAIYDAASNLYSYPEEFIMFVMANPRSRLDLFGRMIEPRGGWTSVSVDSEEWEGKPLAEYGGLVPRVLRFDAEKSPNIVAGRIISRHLPTKAKVAAQRNAAGGQTPLWWSNFRGFPPPTGLSNTVFTESAIVRNDGFGTFVFTGDNFKILGFFDHARNGGDRAVLRFAKYGEIASGVLGIEWLRPIIVGVDVESNVPIDYQLADKVRRHAESIRIGQEEYSCYPQNFGADGTGAGASFVDTLQRMWSPLVHRIIFNAMASDDAVSLEDPRPAREVYENKSVEMHFRARNALDSGQLRGIDKDTAQELVTREFDDSGKRIKLQLKTEYKMRFGKSPDFGDSAVGVCEIARLLNFRLISIGETVHRQVDWEKRVETTQAVYDPRDSFRAEEEDYEEVEVFL